MKKLGILAAAVALMVAILGITAVVYWDNFKTYEIKESMAVGATVESFRLADTNGTGRSLDELKGENGTIVVFVSAQCPTVKQYNARISQFAADFAGRGINVVGINSNSTESLDWARSHAAEHYKFPVLIDKGNVIADKFGANVTPEVYYLDAKNKLVYSGAIDNNNSGNEITKNYLRDAVEATLSGKPVEKKNANAFGCSIKRA